MVSPNPITLVVGLQIAMQSNRRIEYGYNNAIPAWYGGRYSRSIAFRNNVGLAQGDWGYCDTDDKAVNDDAVRLGNRIISSYAIDPKKPCKGYGNNTIWIITESDRSTTTILLPDEY